MKKILISFLVLLTCQLFAQVEKETCVCISNKTKYLQIKTNKDSSRTSFTLLRKDFETKDKRKKALSKFRSVKSTSTGRPTFRVNYYTSNKFKIIDEKQMNKKCLRILTFKEFRSREIFKSGIIFIKKEKYDKIKIWDTILMARE